MTTEPINDLNDLFLKCETIQNDFEDIIQMLWYIYEDFYAVREDDTYTKAYNYDKLKIYLINTYNLLYDKNKEMQNLLSIRKGIKNE